MSRCVVTPFQLLYGNMGHMLKQIAFRVKLANDVTYKRYVSWSDRGNGSPDQSVFQNEPYYGEAEKDGGKGVLDIDESSLWPRDSYASVK